MREFKIGMVVKTLISNSPEMIITGLTTTIITNGKIEEIEIAECLHFNTKNELQMSNIPLTCLRLAD